MDASDRDRTTNANSQKRKKNDQRNHKFMALKSMGIKGRI